MIRITLCILELLSVAHFVMDTHQTHDDDRVLTGELIIIMNILIFCSNMDLVNWCPPKICFINIKEYFATLREIIQLYQGP